jgi:transposase-like protein
LWQKNDRPLKGNWPCLWLEATDLKVRREGRIVKKHWT